jgi:hypothetical protein
VYPSVRYRRPSGAARAGGYEGTRRGWEEGIRNARSPPRHEAGAGFLTGGWRRSTLPGDLSPRTIDADGLNCRVRDGNGCGPVALVASHVRATTGTIWVAQASDAGMRRDQASRAISTARLKRSRVLHLPPINVVVSHGPSGTLRSRSAHLGTGFPLRCFQRLSLPDIANRRCHWRDSRDTSGPSDPVLSY